MPSKIAFVFSASDLDKIESRGFEIVALTPLVKLRLAEKNIRYRVLEDYFNSKEKEDIESYASLWASSWYRGSTEVFKYLRLSMHNYFSKTLFLLSCVDSIVDKKSVKLVFLGKETSGLIGSLSSHFESISPLVKLVCSTKKIELLDYSQKESRLLKQMVQFTLFPGFIKFDFNRKFRSRVFFASNHYHIKSCLELLKKLNGTIGEKPIVFGKIGNAERDLKKDGVDYINYNGEVELRQLVNYLFLKLKFLFVLFQNTSVKKSFKYKGFELVSIFSFKINSLFLQEAPKLQLSRKFISSLIKSIKPKLVITVTNDSLMQAVIGTAKNLGIKNMELQHGLTFGLDTKYSDAENIIVWGKFSKMIYEKLTKGKIFVGGWPEFQKYKNIKILKRKQSRNVLFLAHDPQGLSTAYETMSVDKSFEIFFDAVSRVENISVKVRLHPRADVGIPLAVAKKFGMKAKFSSNESLIEDIEWSDIVVGQTTAASVYPLMLKKPLIYLASMKFPVRFLEQTGAVFEASNFSDLVAKIELLIADKPHEEMTEKIERFLDNYCNYQNNSVNTIFNLSKSIKNE